MTNEELMIVRSVATGKMQRSSKGILHGQRCRLAAGPVPARFTGIVKEIESTARVSCLVPNAVIHRYTKLLLRYD